MIRTSAPGKCILLGEHAVLYDQPGLVTAINRRTTVALEPAATFTIHSAQYHKKCALDLPAFQDLVRRIDKILSLDHEEQRREALQQLRQEPDWDYYPLFYIAGKALHSPEEKPSGFHAHITSDVPSNLGSSSSTYAALARALLCHSGSAPVDYIYARPEVERLTNLGDRLAHGGKVSGIDGYAVTYGGTGCFERRLGGYSFKMKKPLTLLVIDSGEDSTTFVPVQHVRKQYLDNPAEVETIMRTLGAITRTCLATLQNADLTPLLTAFDSYYTTLHKLGISTEKLDTIIALAQQRGLSAKPTGSWGGGHCITLIPEEEQHAISEYCAYFAEHHYQAFPITTHTEGVRIEKLES